MADWEIHGREMATCNCVYACPCQFNALPDKGWCEAAVVYVVERGHHGAVALDGLRMGATYKWPGAVHEGNGTMQLFIDSAATDEQAAALEKIMTGQDTDDMATMWWIFHAMSPNRLPTQRLPISAEFDIAARTGKAALGDVCEFSAEPIRNPVTGAPHRVRIDLPHGFEYRLAEIGSGRASTRGEIELTGIDGTYAQFAELHLSGRGVLEAA
ncbi:DUF1326 domain-containing protein [Paralimibaculum aggregatum]|uniref:DUF1326 domain-containing protein n=1 Tax=Paralimibaculum aggregatum TaxID=3036245 RepID=A0ABQ6LKV5_9RHOB|nr:DUF1326 domain-containing protein [Limibaculum sp. NKW23]GMG82297.1 DUF1326 domain-containing protein [Limibaculum sp. NKW23]